MLLVSLGCERPCRPTAQLQLLWAQARAALCSPTWKCGLHTLFVLSSVCSSYDVWLQLHLLTWMGLVGPMVCCIVLYCGLQNVMWYSEHGDLTPAYIKKKTIFICLYVHIGTCIYILLKSSYLYDMHIYGSGAYSEYYVKSGNSHRFWDVFCNYFRSSHQ